MSNEKMIILKMLKEGKINEEDALKLLDALDKKDYPNNKTPEEKLNNIGPKIQSWVDAINSSVEKAISGIDFSFFSNESKKYSSHRVCDLNLSINDLEKPEIFIENKNSPVKIFSHDGDVIVLKGHISYDKNLIEEKYNFIDMYKENNKIFIKPNYPNNQIKKYPFACSVNLYLPKKIYKMICIKNENSSIELNDLKADSIDACTSNSKIVLNFCHADDIKALSSNAKIILEGSSGKNISAHTSNSSIYYQDSSFEFVDLKTSNSKIAVNNIDDNCIELNAITSNSPVYIECVPNNKNIMLAQGNLGNIMSKVKIDEKYVTINKNDSIILTLNKNCNEDTEYIKVFAKTSNSNIYIK